MTRSPQRKDAHEVVNGSTGTVDSWSALRRFTDARIALGRTGSSLPTAPLLAFNLSHAQARDAVHTPLDTSALRRERESLTLDTIEVASAAAQRDVYLRRPDLGRVLDAHSAARLAEHAAVAEAPPDLIFVIADGLSAKAVATHAVPLIDRTIAQLQGWHIGSIVIATEARVAIGDHIGSLMNAEMVAVLIGERPGLSSPASLGVYLTYRPAVGRSDAERNCISNVRPEGLAYDAAAFKLVHLLEAARRKRLTGVGLKDESVWRAVDAPEGARAALGGSSSPGN
ncbi:ethanolamine ammonia-lyase subunit EutC [Paraburkholderia phosphatilytica]|uniref:ethanolamine ammonia-lyase subunit EutC n=1 Tax=Paraburkholderia phosphatilytica TaxID=2282883 RepID=UPI001F0CCF0A|nr:ethanolamine ammonia-lyase subunit EutC [Paraburkholderia phosphatilytica]